MAKIPTEAEELAAYVRVAGIVAFNLLGGEERKQERYALSGMLAEVAERIDGTSAGTPIPLDALTSFCEVVARHGDNEYMADVLFLLSRAASRKVA